METKYNEIEKMWTRAYAVMVAPDGFREACEKYISGTMNNVLMTRRLLTKANHLIGEVEAVWLTEENMVRLDIKGWDSSPYLTELDEDNDVMQVAALINFYEKSMAAGEFKADADKDGKVSVTRIVDGLIVKPLENGERAFRMEGDVFYVPQDDFYKDIDDYLIGAVSFDIDNMKRLYDRVSTPESQLDYKVFRKAAKAYLKREIEEQTLSDALELPCGDETFEVHNVPEEMDSEWTFEDARLDKVYVGSGVGYEGNVVFEFSNGRIEDIDEIDLCQLWTIVYTIEYRKNCHYKDLSEMAKHIKADAPKDFAWMAKEFIYRIVYERMHSSRWCMWNGDLSLTIMNKNNEPIGLLYDIVCKNGNVKVELSKEGCLAYGNIKYEDMGGVVDFDELSPISMAHLIEYVGRREETDNFSHIHHFEKDGVRVPYRILNGEKIGSAESTWDEDMNAINVENGIKKVVTEDVLYYDEDEWIGHAPQYVYEK